MFLLVAQLYCVSVVDGREFPSFFAKKKKKLVLEPHVASLLLFDLN